ncbi:YaiO family outer membrane beta-barrel protein [Chitinophaga caseinilytica]|uniref:YaiO family outer membrane beta-barrel protein n=1 Tax=Chitinophaga caseinilytica TaxID=2267521 RepID=A0ABZ2ZBG8_9BACT
MRHILLTVIAAMISIVALAQDSDELFQLARKAAFDRKDYPEAIRLCRQALAKSPDYADIRVFLGRIYTWSDKTDSARAEFQYILQRKPEYEDAYVAIADLEYWNDRPAEAMQHINKGLEYHPQSEELLLRKARVLGFQKNLQEAAIYANKVLTINPNNAAARSLLSGIRDQVRKNKLDLSYDYTYFDKRFDDPWHMLSLAYGRQTPIGSVFARVNYAKKFGDDGVQGEVEAYPRFSNTFYSYVGAGYSNSSIFPKYRAGFSLYANLPKSFEAELGFRYLYFSSSTWVYTASLGKYWRSWWFNFRTYLTPGEDNLSKSFNLNARYYTAGADDFWLFGIGTGISPDDRRNNINYEINNSLMSYKLNLGWQKTFLRQNIIGLYGTWYYEEFRPSTYGNQINLGVSLMRRF